MLKSLVYISISFQNGWTDDQDMANFLDPLTIFQKSTVAAAHSVPNTASSSARTAVKKMTMPAG